MDASVFPTVTIAGGSGAAVGSLADYLGVPTGVNNIEVSALPFRGYSLIWNEWYRDQDLETALTIDKTSGADTTTNTTLQHCAWEKDYFTSARPWTQKGPEINVPLGTSAPIYGTDVDTIMRPSNNTGSEGPLYADTGATPNLRIGGSSTHTPGSSAWFSTDSAEIGLEADLSTATSATINELREAFALQRYQEARARYGSRYTEYLRYLGVTPSDARLQRPEYLGGGKQTIQFSEVIQTAEGTNPVGELRGHGIGALRSNRYRRFFEEHGYVYTFISVKPKTIYAQGLPRTWNRRTKEDFFQKELQFIGQQEVLNKELYAAHATPNGTFGYQDRYDEYRRQESTIAGQFRGSQLNMWHMARLFSSDPALNATFVKCIPTDRVYAVPSEHVLWCMVNHSIQARRLVAKMADSKIF